MRFMLFLDVQHATMKRAAAGTHAEHSDRCAPAANHLIATCVLACVQDAQNALRRIMETHSNVTRFCFICNYVSRIIEPLASRCAKFRFKPLHEGIMEERIKTICQSEDVQLGPGALQLLGRVSHGDLRRAITTLQSAAALTGNPVKTDTLIDVSGEVRTACLLQCVCLGLLLHSRSRLTA